MKNINNKKTISFFIFIIGLILFFSCKESNKSSTYRPNSKGVPNVISVVSDSVLYNTGLVQFLMDSANFGRPFVGLIAPPEPRLAPRNISYNYFKKHQTLRNVLYIKSGKPSFKIIQDSIAKPQVFVEVTGENLTEIKNLIAQNMDKMVSLYRQADDTYMLNEQIDKQIKDYTHLNKMGMAMVIPRVYKVAEQESDFIWYRDDINEDIINIMFYKYPAKDSIQVNDLITLRNLTNQKYTKGSNPNDYAKTEEKIPVSINILSQNNNQIIYELRGYWSMNISVLGGPFITRVIYDKSKKELYFADTFIYAPFKNMKSKKRDYLVKLESLLSTFKTIK